MRGRRRRNGARDALAAAEDRVEVSERRATRDLDYQLARADSESGDVSWMKAMRNVNHIAAMVAASLSRDESARGAL